MVAGRPGQVKNWPFVARLLKLEGVLSRNRLKSGIADAGSMPYPQIDTGIRPEDPIPVLFREGIALLSAHMSRHNCVGSRKGQGFLAENPAFLMFTPLFVRRKDEKMKSGGTFLFLGK